MSLSSLLKWLLKGSAAILPSEPGIPALIFKVWNYGYFMSWRERCDADREGYNSAGDYLLFAYRAKDKLPVTIFHWWERL